MRHGGIGKGLSACWLQIAFSVYLCLSQWVCASVCVCEQFYVVLILQLAFCNLRHEDQMDAPSPLALSHVVVGDACAGVDDKGLKWRTKGAEAELR